MRRVTQRPISSPASISAQSTQAYEIRVLGDLDRDLLADRYNELEFSYDPDRGETILRGPIPSQADLYGLLFKFRDPNLALLSVKQLPVSP